MRNIIKADLYRILRGKGTYITLAIFIMIIIIQVADNGINILGIHFSGQGEVPYETTVPFGNDGSMMRIATGKSVPFIMATNTDNLIYFLLPFIVFFAAADFKNETVKNLLSSGMDRVKYYFAKLILIAGASVFLILSNLIIMIITATAINGFRGDFSAIWLLQIAEIYLPQMYLLFAFGCVGTFLIFAIKSTAALNTVYIAFSFVPIVALTILSEYSERFENLPYYDLVINMKSFAFSCDIATIQPDLTRALILGGIYITACTIGGIALFRKSEVK